MNDLNLELSWTWVQLPPPPPFFELLNSMKHLLENWRQYVKEDLEIDVGEREEDVILYHVSSTPDIEILDPAIAAAKVKNYTKQEYRTWDRPRVFYFTNWGQEDSGIGKIQGHPYAVKIKQGDLYPVLEDPLGLSRRVDEYKKIREQEEGIPPYYPTNPYEMVATLGEREYGFKGFIYPQSDNTDNRIVALWKAVPAEKLEKSFYDTEE